MSNSHQPTSNSRWWIKLLAPLILSLLLLARIGYSQTQAASAPTPALLEASLRLELLGAAPSDPKGKIQPGKPVKLAVTVENEGQQPSPAGQLYVRYAFPAPLRNEPGSMIFETEKKPLPSIEPGKQVDIAFEIPHQMPSLLDFIRDDWAMREYQAVAIVDQKETVIGTLILTFSAHYYTQE